MCLVYFYSCFWYVLEYIHCLEITSNTSDWMQPDNNLLHSLNLITSQFVSYSWDHTFSPTWQWDIRTEWEREKGKKKHKRKTRMVGKRRAGQGGRERERSNFFRLHYQWYWPGRPVSIGVPFLSIWGNQRAMEWAERGYSHPPGFLVLLSVCVCVCVCECVRVRGARA